MRCEWDSPGDWFRQRVRVGGYVKMTSSEKKTSATIIQETINDIVYHRDDK